MGAESQTQVLWKESKLLLTAESSPQPLILVFMMDDVFSLGATELSF